MPTQNAGDLCSIGDVEGFQFVQPATSTDALLGRLITAASQNIARELARDLMSLGGQSQGITIASIGSDAGGAFITLSTPLPAIPMGPAFALANGQAPYPGSSGSQVQDWASRAKTTVITPAGGLLNTTSKVYVASTASFVVGDQVGFQTVYQETYDGRGNNRMSLNEWPVGVVGGVTGASPSVVMVNQANIPSSVGPGVAGFCFEQKNMECPATLYLVGYYPFARGYRNIQVSYAAGYPMPPDDLRQVCVEMVQERLKVRRRQGQTSVAMGGQSVAFSTKDITPETKRLLDNFRRVMPSG